MPVILTIEDEANILNNIAEILDMGGYEVLTAIDGTRGLELAHKHKPDLILCDINMPDMDGYSVLMHLQSQTATSYIPLVFLTAYVSRDFRRRGMNLGAVDYLTKPFTPSELLEMVDAQLKRASVQQSGRERELNELRDSILLSLPHEMRTPLTGLVTCADILMMDVEEDDINPERLRQMIGIIRSSGDRLQRLIENYLIYSQLQIMSGDPESRRKLTIGEGIDRPSMLIEDKAIEVANHHKRTFDLNVGNLPEIGVKVSAGNLTKIMTELVDNAFKFSSAGEPVTVSAVLDGDFYVLTIQDGGRGFKDGQIESVGAYRQFDRDHYEQQGLGLGLSIAQRMVELHGGTLSITSTEGMGTTITVRLLLT